MAVPGNHLGALRHADDLIQLRGFDFIGLGRASGLWLFQGSPSDSYEQLSLRITKVRKQIKFFSEMRDTAGGRGQLAEKEG